MVPGLRYGNRTELGRWWMSRGRRPQCPMKCGCKCGYLYQAHRPSTGDIFEMFLPDMGGDCFRLSIRSFAEAHPGQVMIMDNASSHHVEWGGGLPPPDIRIGHLPPYSPDFNPQGRLFQEMCKPLKGRFYEDPKEIGRDITERLKEYQDHPEKVSELTAYGSGLFSAGFLKWIWYKCNFSGRPRKACCGG